MKKVNCCKPKAFTLVELIVVITILAILGTIGFISFIGYQKSARESVRVSDLNIMKSGLEYFSIENSYYPNPDSYVTMSQAGEELWKQGSFGENVAVSVKRISDVPLDPLTDSQYTYSTTYNKQEYQLASIGEISTESLSLNTQTYAANTYFAHIIGNYNGAIISKTQGDNIRIYGIPSLITSTGSSSEVSSILNTFVLENGENIPASYSSTIPENEMVQEIPFLPGPLEGTMAPLLYSGSLIALSTVDHNKNDFGENFISYYQDIWNIINTSPYDTAQPIHISEYFVRNSVGGINSTHFSESRYYGAFVTTWKTDGNDDSDTITIRTGGGSFNYTVDWGDGTVDSGVTGDIFHTYSNTGTYTVQITGDFPHMSINHGTYKDKILSVENWGVQEWESFSAMFRGAGNLRINAIDIPNMENVTRMDRMFEGNEYIGVSISAWDTSNIINMDRLFAGVNEIEANISQWDVSNVENMSRMFWVNSSFNQDLSGWDISSVTNYSDFDLGATNWTLPKPSF